MKLAEILTGPDTWGKGFRKLGNRFCLLGALSQLLNGNSFASVSRNPEFDRLTRIVGAEVTSWNDDPARTWDEVQTVRDNYDRDRMLNP